MAPLTQTYNASFIDSPRIYPAYIVASQESRENILEINRRTSRRFPGVGWTRHYVHNVPGRVSLEAFEEWKSEIAGALARNERLDPAVVRQTVEMVESCRAVLTGR